MIPAFFLVGGYSNGVSWDATLRKAEPGQIGKYRDWFASRVQRLINPTFPLLMLWAVLAVILTQVGFPREQILMAPALGWALVPGSIAGAASEVTAARGVDRLGS